MFIMQNAAIEMHWLMVNHVSRLKKAEKPKMLVWRTEFGRGVFFGGKLNKPCGYWFCQKWLLIISKRPKKSSEWCYFNLTPPTDHGTILRRSPPLHCLDTTVETFPLLPVGSLHNRQASFYAQGLSVRGGAALFFLSSWSVNFPASLSFDLPCFAKC